MCNLCKGARVKVACFAYYYGDDLDLEFFFSDVSHYVLLEWLVDVRV